MNLEIFHALVRRGVLGRIALNLPSVEAGYSGDGLCPSSQTKFMIDCSDDKVLPSLLLGHCNNIAKEKLKYLTI